MSVLTPPGHWDSWEDIMDVALAQARLAARSGEVPVGALILDPEGDIISQAYNCPIAINDPSGHAEMLAIRQACSKVNNYRLNDMILVVTLEPCLMCVGAIIHARIAGVVYAAEDHKTGAIRSQLPGSELPFTNHRFWYLAGIGSQESSQLLRTFFDKRRKNRQKQDVLG